MLDYNEIKEGKIIIYENEPFEVLTSWVFRKQQRKPVNQTKLKNLITGRIAEVTFHDSDKVREAEIEKREAKYLYSAKGEIWFVDPKNPKNRFTLSEVLIGDQKKFLKENTLVTVLVFVQNEEEKIIGVKLPIKIDFRVVEAPPSIKGDTAAGGSKQVKLETGAVLNVPLFINEGEVIRVNTETGQYVERTENKF